MKFRYHHQSFLRHFKLMWIFRAVYHTAAVPRARESTVNVIPVRTVLF